MAAAANIEITSMELIKPSSPTPHHSKEHKLSFLDQFLIPSYIPLIFFYESQSCSNISDHSKRSQHLKHSLSESLTKFYHLAGRIKGNVSIICNDLGAQFVEAQVHAPLLQAIQNLPIDELNQYLPLEPFAFLNEASNSDPKNDDDDVPLLSVQISFFECGGTAIGVCMSHKVADLASLMMFMNYWAALNVGEKIDPLDDQQPNCDRASKLFPGINEDSPFPRFPKNGGKEKLIRKKFLFDKEKLAALKQLIASSSDDFSAGFKVKDPTRVESVSAFIWKQFIDISRAKGDSKTMFLATHMVNLRSRMKSSIHSEDLEGFNNVFGNLSIISFPSSNSEGVNNNYQELASILRTEIRRIDDDYIKNVQSGVPYRNAGNDARRQLNNQQEMIMEYCHFTSWCRFPYYELDYGWGKPVSVCTLGIPLKNAVILMSTKCGDGIEAWITMLEDEMAMLSVELLSLESTSYY